MSQIWSAKVGYSATLAPHYHELGESAWAAKPWTKDQERELVERAVRRDRAAFARLYDMYVDKIYRYLYFKSGNRQEAEDMTAQVFLKAWESIGKFHWIERPFVSWLYRIAHNLVVDHFRAHQDAVSLDIVEPIPSRGASLYEIAEQRLTSALLQTILQQLTTEQHKVILLRFVEGYDTADTARVMAKTEGAVRTLQHRALRALARIIAKSGTEFELIGR